MKTFKEFFENCKSVSYKLNENSFSFSGSNKLVDLNGSYDGSLVINIKSKTGNTLYSYNESINEMNKVYNKITEAIDIFDGVSSIDNDLEREDDSKEILLDDADIPEEDSTVFNEIEDIDVTNKDESTSEETAKVDVSIFSKVRNELLNIANENAYIADAINENDTDIKSLAIGLLANIYDCANGFDSFIECYFNKDLTNESICVPSKTDFIDVASNGISQACMALKQSKNYEPLIGILKDINSELKLKN